MPRHSTGGRWTRGGGKRGPGSASLIRSTLAGLVGVTALAVAAVAPAAGAATSAAAATAGPSCTFNGSTLPLVTGVEAGSKIDVACTGLPALHPYLMLQTSLLLAVDPKAAPLLEGNVVSLSGLLALVNALPEINPGSLSFVTSNLSGDLDTTYTVPTTQPPDPNATCPPPTIQFNSGLIGCALATIDLSSFKPLTQASGLMVYGDEFLPPSPTLAVSVKKASAGQTVDVSDKPGATTYWWIETLASLEALLGGGTTPQLTTSVTVGSGRRAVTATSSVTIAPPTYNGSTFTPPALSGSFVVPAGVRGRQKVTVTAEASLDGLPLANVASTHVTIGR